MRPPVFIPLFHSDQYCFQDFPSSDIGSYDLHLLPSPHHDNHATTNEEGGKVEKRKVPAARPHLLHLGTDIRRCRSRHQDVGADACVLADNDVSPLIRMSCCRRIDFENGKAKVAR
jgi:hypothetical protein